MSSDSYAPSQQVLDQNRIKGYSGILSWEIRVKLKIAKQILIRIQYFYDIFSPSSVFQSGFFFPCGWYLQGLRATLYTYHKARSDEKGARAREYGCVRVMAEAWRGVREETIAALPYHDPALSTLWIWPAGTPFCFDEDNTFTTL